MYATSDRQPTLKYGTARSIGGGCCRPDMFSPIGPWQRSLDHPDAALRCAILSLQAIATDVSLYAAQAGG